MANKEQILVKVDQNNLLYIDPNSVVVDGNASPRGNNPEDLVMYVNLEADIIPRTVLSANAKMSTLQEVAKGTLNFLQNHSNEDNVKDGNPRKDYFDSSWTELYVGDSQDPEKISDVFGDRSGQSFGISNVSIETKGVNFIPSVEINFIDVRGKTLFESPPNSPYKAFFHLPWPIFYLTVKGYYGKTIRYRLHLINFSSKYNASNGNFEISTKFIGSTYAYLNDIPLPAIINAPYMFINQTSKPGVFNEKTGLREQKVSPSSRGYATLKSIYAEYKQKKLIPEDFPIVTLRQIINKAQSIDAIIESEIFSNVANMGVFAGVKEFGDNLIKFEKEVTSWKNSHLTSAIASENKTNPEDNYYQLIKSEKTDTKWIVGNDVNGTLETIIKQNVELLKKSQLFTNSLIKDNRLDFSGVNLNAINPIGNISDYYQKFEGNWGVKINRLILNIQSIETVFSAQEKKLQDIVEEKINIILKDKKGGLGFEPTIRNIFAIILAGADTYIRLMKETHFNAYNVGEERKSIISDLVNESKGEPIYPWPEIVKNGARDKRNVMVYPGSPDLISKLQSDNPRMWPEVDFVENFIKIGLTQSENQPSHESENISYVFDNDDERLYVKKISTIDSLNVNLPYISKTIDAMLYEIAERNKYSTFYNTFNSETIKELADLEFQNINKSIITDPDIAEFLLKNIDSPTKLNEMLLSYSPYIKYPYYVDNLPTTQYIVDGIENSFKLESYVVNDSVPDDSIYYPLLEKNLNDYKPETYRLSISPFNTSTYLSYLDETKFTDDLLKFNGTLNVKTKNTFIASTINPKSWSKNQNDLFSNTLAIGNDGYVSSMLNTPYFHQQLFTDFGKTTSYGRYSGSAYLLLNSLPFYDLNDTINFEGVGNVLMSSLFREVGSSHFIPYHLILKWGSIYHRYKKQILEGVDIINDVTLPVDGNLFFNNSTTDMYNGRLYSNNKDVGMRPYYESIFHQIVNGYLYYDVMASGGTKYNESITSGVLKTNSVSSNSLNYHTSFVDNSVWGDNKYTIIPSTGNKSKDVIGIFNDSEQNNFKILWTYDDSKEFIYSGRVFPSTNEYFQSTSNTKDYKLDGDHRKIIDLIATFSPDILNIFELEFLQFATERPSMDSVINNQLDVKQNNFQNLLKDIVSVEKKGTDDIITTEPKIIDGETVIISNQSRFESVTKEIKLRQGNKLIQITNDILSNDNLVKLTISNPKELNLYTLGGFTNMNNTSLNFNIYDISQTVNEKYITLYIGEDLNLFYKEFFTVNDIELSEENVLQLRPIIQIYGGYRESGNVGDVTLFKKYLYDNIFYKSESRQYESISKIITKFKTIVPDLAVREKIENDSGFGTDETIRLELYKDFKSFNDKWTAGNSIGQRLLLEEFLFLDKANKDIGNKLFIDIKKLLPLMNASNANQNLYGVIALLITGTNIDLRALPSYVNFYGSNFSNKTKLSPSNTVANTLFGKYLEVDYQESSPKIILQYVGETSKYLDLSEINKRAGSFKNDSFDIGNTNNNSLLETNPDYFNPDNLSKSNKVVAFEVSIGDQNQSIFKTVQLDQSQFKNTYESMLAIENLNAARSEQGAGVMRMDTGLFDIYRTQSYSCEVTCMGNVMIQPTMYFYLKNIPLFNGTYWIVDVTHKISDNKIETTFKGVRISNKSLPDPKESYYTTSRNLFQKVINRAVVKIKEQQQLISSGVGVDEKTYTTVDGKPFTVDYGNKPIPQGEEIMKQIGITEFGVPYNDWNGEKFIQKVKRPDGSEWLKTRVIKMGGSNNYLHDDHDMGLVRTLDGDNIKPHYLNWGEIKDKQLQIYSTNFSFKGNSNKIMGCKTTFLNPLNNITKSLVSTHQLNSDLGVRTITGPVDIMSTSGGYGMAMSFQLMSSLKLLEGDVVYFKME